LAFLDIQTIVAISGRPPVFPWVYLKLICHGNALEQEVYTRNWPASIYRPFVV
jgi:hypothetical protein